MGRHFTKKRMCAGRGGLACTRPTSTSGCQILGTLVRGSPKSSSPAWRTSAPKAPVVPHLTPSQPRGRNPQPARQRPTAAWRPARAVRKEEPARRPRKGPRLPRRVRAEAPARPLQAGRPARCAPRPTAAAQALDTATFIFLNALGKKAKAKTAERRARVRGERGARAGSQKRGPRPRVCARRCRRRSGWSRVPEISQPKALVAAAQRALARLRGPRRLGPLALLPSSAFRFSARRGLAAAGGPQT